LAIALAQKDTARAQWRFARHGRFDPLAFFEGELLVLIPACMVEAACEPAREGMTF
jgi:hypothetical protein